MLSFDAVGGRMREMEQETEVEELEFEITEKGLSLIWQESASKYSTYDAK